MNKYTWIAIIGVLILGGGIIYRVAFLKSEDRPMTTGEIVKVTVTAVKDAWLFEPEEIEVNRGDKVIMTVVNEDSYDHGFAIDKLGISQRMPANSTIKIEFVATQPGEFQYYCSVPCGEGEYKGVKRTHFNMIGKIKVRDVVKEDKNPLPNQ